MFGMCALISASMTATALQRFLLGCSGRKGFLVWQRCW